MSTAVLINDDKTAFALMHWAGHFARGLKSDIVVLNAVRKKGEGRVEEIDLAAPTESPIVEAVRAVARELSLAPSIPGQEERDDEHAGRIIRFVRITAGNLVEATLEQLGEVRADLLLVPRHVASAQEGTETLERELADRAPCDTVQLRPGTGDPKRCKRMLVAASGGQHATAALRLSHAVCAESDGELTALYVEPPVGYDAELVGQRILDRIVQRALGGDAGATRKRVVLAKNILHGITEACTEDDDIVLVGATGHGAVRRLLFSRISDRLLMRETVSAVAIVRAAIPLRSRFQAAIDRRMRGVVPQVNRADRVALTERIQSSSQSDFDFIALMCLSTLIAALGLVGDSGAVVIGAMLVAPLMTPLLGMGLALVQGNRHLLRLAARTVSIGFLVALVVGWLTGMINNDNELTAEMAARCTPDRVDLFIATASGLAAAYAIGRPGLLSALPGVAIAAALVPPIATSGLALADGYYAESAAAAKLFLVNIVAIVLGTAVSFWAVGIRASQVRTATDRWIWAAGILLVVAGVELTVILD